MEFNQLLKNARAKANKTLEQVAKDCGVSKATVQRWESGEIKNVRRDKISKLSASLNVSPAYLMGWEDEDESPLGNYDENIKYLKESDQEELIELYEDILANDRLSILFDKAKQLSPEDLEQVLKIIDTFNKESR